MLLIRCSALTGARWRTRRGWRQLNPILNPTVIRGPPAAVWPSAASWRNETAGKVALASISGGEGFSSLGCVGCPADVLGAFSRKSVAPHARLEKCSWSHPQREASRIGVPSAPSNSRMTTITGTDGAESLTMSTASFLFVGVRHHSGTGGGVLTFYDSLMIIEVANRKRSRLWRRR